MKKSFSKSENGKKSNLKVKKSREYHTKIQKLAKEDYRYIPDGRSLQKAFFFKYSGKKVKKDKRFQR